MRFQASAPIGFWLSAKAMSKARSSTSYMCSLPRLMFPDADIEGVLIVSVKSRSAGIEPLGTRCRLASVIRRTQLLKVDRFG